MNSLAYIPGSDGTANASLMTVQSVRSPLATTIAVNTTSGVPASFYATMGTPHTFTDPVTGETITIISEDTAVDFAGIIDAGNLEIVEIAPGYTDLGSEVGDIVIIRPITEWANNLFNLLSISLNDDGTLQTGAADRALNPPQGFLINGKISRTVASNNITVAIKTLADGTPSADDPVYVRIGDTVRAITAALSVTKNAGTNWMSLGSAQHATQDVDVFVYLGYNATDGVTIGFSRIPYARTYSDFSATTTNEKYAAISTITNAAASDVYELVGRANVTLSASASYNWSIPATSIVINRPIFQTRWLSYAPVLTNFTGTINVAKYQITDQNCEFYVKVTQGASVTGQHVFSVPIEINASRAVLAPINIVAYGYILDLGLNQYPAQGQLISSTTVGLLTTNVAGTYPIPVATSPTVPMTWSAGNDPFMLEGRYQTV